MSFGKQIAVERIYLDFNNLCQDLDSRIEELVYTIASAYDSPSLNSEQKAVLADALIKMDKVKSTFKS